LRLDDVKSSDGTPSGTPTSGSSAASSNGGAEPIADAGPPRNRPSTVLISSRASNGLVTIASQPDASARSRSNGSNVPVRRMTGMRSVSDPLLSV
jgi:hypothetical protein